MGQAKLLEVRPVPKRTAEAFVRRYHYSRKVSAGQQLFLGVFQGRRMVGALTFGKPINVWGVLGLVRDSGWSSVLELGRMAMVEDTPRNSESRAIAVAVRLIRRHYPHVEWLLTYADASACGDGTIYRACGFLLTKVERNRSIIEHPDHGTLFTITLTADRRAIQAGGGKVVRQYLENGWSFRPGFQLRYIKFLDPTQEHRLTVPVLPYSEIQRKGAGMYRGQATGTAAT